MDKILFLRSYEFSIADNTLRLLLYFQIEMSERAPVYTVEDIVAKRVRVDSHGNFKEDYYIKWEGFGEEFNTWEPLSMFEFLTPEFRTKTLLLTARLNHTFIANRVCIHFT